MPPPRIVEAIDVRPVVRRSFFSFEEIFSYEIGAIKPERAIYQAVLLGLETEADKVLFVGDTKRTDIEGPAKFGFSTLDVGELCRDLLPIQTSPYPKSSKTE